jgi:hypothetical protein
MGLVILFTLAFAYQNCAQYSDNSLFDAASSAAIPTSTPRLDFPTQNIEVAVTDDQISFGSTCQWGASSKHYLEFKLYTNGGRPVKVQSSSTCTSSTDSECYRNIAFRCEHGRYYVVLPVTCDSYNGLGVIAYKLTGQMVTYDSGGSEVRDPQAYFERQILIDWNSAAAKACGH